jgi:hypothetical protein
MAFNVVELAASIEGDEEAFDQRCRFGHRVDGHAVYCHHDQWDDAPRKCRRTWYTNGRIKDEECAGFEANLEFKGEFVQIAAPQNPCPKCKGKKIVKADRGKTTTCPLCVGSGENPAPVALTAYEQNTLELGTTHSGRHDTAGHSFVRIAETQAEYESINKLIGLNLVVLRSVSFAGGDCSVFLLENTCKGEAVMQANWKVRESKPH